MARYRNPGFYSEVISVASPAVEEVETALPAFVGYTSKALMEIADDLIMVPTKIDSIKEYLLYFGGSFENKLEIEVQKDSSERLLLASLKESSLQYLLYYSAKIYFENGGTPCYILSVGTYLTPQQVVLQKNATQPYYGLLDGLHKLAEVSDLTLILIPEAVKLPVNDFSTLVQAALLQCNMMGNRFAIFDLYHGDRDDPDLPLNRGLFGSKYLNYGSVYYPFIQTKMSYYDHIIGQNVKVLYDGAELKMDYLKETNKRLFRFVNNVLKQRFIVLPSCSVVAGVYVTTDIKRGVWKSPANLSLVGVMEPVVDIDNQRQDTLNADPEYGKSINSIRLFSGKGTVVWGARTLAGNDNEWRYVPVHRFFIMVKESLRKSTSWIVFEPNNSGTWLKISGMIEKYLTQKWQEGALAGITPNVAFYVKCGVGTSMTDQDILEGRIRIEVGLAMLRPAEFIVLRFSHLLKSVKAVADC